MEEGVKLTSNRKLEHLILCLCRDVEHKKKSGFQDIELIHRALPEINKDEIDISVNFLGKKLESPFMITGITGGHEISYKINKELAKAAKATGVALGLGSQRVAIENPELEYTYTIVREVAEDAFIIGNIGVSHVKYAKKAVEMVDADALAIHLNPLQEAIQPEGITHSKKTLEKIGKIVKELDVPVIVKETGAGICYEDAKLLKNKGVAAIDVAGAGGTSWSAVEAYRSKNSHLGKLYWDWGIPTAISTVEVREAVDIPVIASGGIRTGLDAAKAIALGADIVGMALPIMKKAFFGYKEVISFIENFNEELKIAMYLVGAKNIEELKKCPLVIRGKVREWLHERGFDTKKYARRSLHGR
ncbi:isopentenyl-diphosphate delta-isomerase [Methanothermus fervidus DSM 2088]|uniref:Isopentenyl-diphosphate delta-isomerase n=1 Tax=Methanothermus fervidus (strain ATCC 43054 / DSM 2088 / JCM 10308 / V24 S) TaxID=523846 RepID=E3GZG3_METFV|nr:isopentenyl-diphosphate delta-isomerase [Methanothermus fervidus DSM 2088]